MWQDGEYRLAHPGIAPGTRYLLFHQFTTHIDQLSVLDSRGAGSFTVAAGQAAIQVDARVNSGCVAFDDLLDEIDATARAVQFITEQIVGRTGRQTEAAMNTFAQNGFGREDTWIIRKRGCNRGIHQALRLSGS